MRRRSAAHAGRQENTPDTKENATREKNKRKTRQGSNLTERWPSRLRAQQLTSEGFRYGYPTSSARCQRQSIAFDPARISLHFDRAAISARTSAWRRGRKQPGHGAQRNGRGQERAAAEYSPLQLATSNVGFANGSQRCSSATTRLP
jgi:hypothetical protein